jgi:predicted ATP-grasp superfamily ATP-dependent carboligase
MLQAALEDFQRIRGVQTLTLLHDRCACDFEAGVRLRCTRESEQASFQQLASIADYSFIVAPENDDTLLTRCRWVGKSGGNLLGASPDSVALCGDKLALSHHLQCRGVRTPVSRYFSTNEIPCYGPFPLVWKPRYGAGSQATFLVKDEAELRACADRALLEHFASDAIVQPFVSGLPVSVSFLVGPHSRVALLPAAQHLSSDGRFRYLGGSVPLPSELARRAVQLATQALESIPGLMGYVGVDLVLGDAGDGSQDWVVEINPRLTTSYVGLRTLARTNLAEALLQAANGVIPAVTWRSATVDFLSDGRVGMKSG